MFSRILLLFLILLLIINSRKSKQILNKLVKQKIKIKRDFGKIYYNIETNEEEIKEIKKKLILLEELFVKEKSKIKFMMIVL